MPKISFKRLSTKSNKLSLLFTLVVVVVMVMYVWHNRAVFAELVQVRWPFVVCLALLWILYISVPGIRFKVFLKSFGVKLSFIEWFGLAVITDMSSLILPFQTGSIPSAVYLKTRHNFSYAQFTSILAGGYLLFFLATSIMGLVVSGLFYLTYGKIVLKIVLFFAIVLAGTLVIFAVSPLVVLRRDGLVGFGGRVLEGWKVIRNNRLLISTITAVYGVGSIIVGLAFYFGYQALSLDVNFMQILLVSMVTQYAIFIKFTPANLGIREAVFAMVSELMGVGFNQGLVAAFLFRSVDLLLVAVTGPIFSYILFRRAWVLGAETSEA